MQKLKIKTQAFVYVEKSFQEWLETLGYAASTVYGLPRYVHEFLYYLEQNKITLISEIETNHFREHFERLKSRTNERDGGGLSNNYLNKHLQSFYKFAEYLRQSGRLILPALKINWETTDTRAIEFLTQEEIADLYKATYGHNLGTILEPFNARDRAMLTIFYGCGLRRNEGYSLDVSDINLDRQILHVRKGKNYKERFVPFNKTAANYLQEYIYDARQTIVHSTREEAFFISQRGTRMDTQSISLRLKLLQQRTDNLELKNKSVRLHVLRHSIATHLLQNGMSLENIARFLGHSSLESTQVYTHLGEAEKNGEEPETKQQPYRNIPKHQYVQLHEDEL